MDHAEIANWGILSFPIYYGRLALGLWRNDHVQLLSAAIGTGVILTGVARLGQFIWSHFLRPSALQRYCHAETGSWALVTGASDGIGRAFADELLDRGFNVLLHARNEEKLQGIQAALRDRFPRRRVEYVVADASRTDGPELRVLEKVQALSGKLTILVNNVGGLFTKPMFQTVEASSPQDLDNVLNLNITFATHVTSVLLPELKKNSPALILNAGSMAGVFGLPMIATYSGTKAYILAWTQGLRGEMLAEKADVEVKGLIIGNTKSNSNSVDRGFGTITSTQCAKGSLDQVGAAETLVYPHWTQAVQLTMVGLLPERYLLPLMVKEMSKQVEHERKGV
nr:very-long-chain 3-oxoacyl-coa reductase 1 [Quercus suber]